MSLKQQESGTQLVPFMVVKPKPKIRPSLKSFLHSHPAFSKPVPSSTDSVKMVPKLVPDPVKIVPKSIPEPRLVTEPKLLSETIRKESETREEKKSKQKEEKEYVGCISLPKGWRNSLRKRRNKES